MKKLHNVSLTLLQVLEFGQFIKSSIANTQAVGAITDASTLAFLAVLIAKSAEYDLAMMHIAKSNETAKILKADTDRDNAVTVFELQLLVYKYAETDVELEAYTNLTNVMNVYKDVQRMNFEEESNAIDNLLIELNNDTNQPSILTLSMDSLVSRMTAKNETFKTLFLGRTQETANKGTFNVKLMRKDTLLQYQNFANYILSMASLQPASQFNTILNALNAVRKYYHDMLAIRAGKAGDITPIVPIPE